MAHGAAAAEPVGDLFGLGRAVLVVEDEPDLLEILGAVFAAEGYHTLLAADGEAAIHLARTERPALITLDLMLPKKSGHEVLAELAADPATRSIPVVVVSAYTGVLAPTAQVRAVVLKPFDVDRLLEIAARLTGAARPALERR
jgi:twitching motility two-component system response regulator PilH